MEKRKTKFKVAAVQAAPVFLNQAASVDKACLLIEEAAKQGAELIALPEVFIPGGPYWAWHRGVRDGVPFFIQLYENSVEIPSGVTKRLGEAVKQWRVHTVVGVSEKRKRMAADFYSRHPHQKMEKEKISIDHIA